MRVLCVGKIFNYSVSVRSRFTILCRRSSPCVRTHIRRAGGVGRVIDACRLSAVNYDGPYGCRVCRFRLTDGADCWLRISVNARRVPRDSTCLALLFPLFLLPSPMCAARLVALRNAYSVRLLQTLYVDHPFGNVNDLIQFDHAGVTSLITMFSHIFDD